MTRWIRLNVDWEDSPWLDKLPGQAAGCWPRLLCWVKLRGNGGRCRKPDPSVLARRWRVSRESVDELIQAAAEDGALEINDGVIVVANWDEYQNTDWTAVDRMRKYRSRQAALRRNGS